MRTSRLAAFLVIPVACAMLSACWGPGEEDARGVIEAMEKARKDSSVDKWAWYFSNDCTYHSSFTKPDGTTAESSKTCRQYLDSQREAIAKSESSGIDRYTLFVIRNISRMGGKTKAVVYVSVSGARILEAEQKVDSATLNMDETVTLESREGKTMITAVDVKATDLHVNGKDFVL